MATKIRPADIAALKAGIQSLTETVRVLSNRVNELDKEALSGYNELRRTAAEDKAWLQGQIDINTKAISTINNDLYKHYGRIATLEHECKMLRRSRFSFKTYLSRLFNALRNKP